MANIKDIAESSDKWARRAGQAGEDYERGVRNPRRQWSQGAAAAEGNYKSAVTAAANAGRFGAGIKRAGEAKWQQAAINKGPGRFAEGVNLARPSYEKGFAPFHTAIKSLQLPVRGPKGSPQNLQRVAIVAKALREVSQKRGA